MKVEPELTTEAAVVMLAGPLLLEALEALLKDYEEMCRIIDEDEVRFLNLKSSLEDRYAYANPARYAIAQARGE